MWQSSVCARIMQQLDQAEMANQQRRVCIINQDSFYRNLSPEEHTKALQGDFNFDHPGDTSLTVHLIVDCLSFVIEDILPASTYGFSWCVFGKSVGEQSVYFDWMTIG